MRTRALFAALLAFLLGETMSADARGIAKAILAQADAPVAISSCSADVGFVENTYSRTTMSYLTTGVDFTSTSTKTAVAVLFRLQLENAFGDVIDNQFAQATGQFAPNVAIVGNRWSNVDSWAGLGIVQCSVSRVLYADGSVWKDPGSPAPPTPSPSP